MPYQSQDSYETGVETLAAQPFEFGTEGEVPGAAGSPLSEIDEMEYAAGLLEITDEAELDQFLGSLLKKATRAAGGALNTPLGRALGGLLKGAIKKALPGIGSAIGGLVPGGSAVGGQLASTAGQLLGLELEGLSSEDQEFEVARGLVRFVGAATNQAAQIAPGVNAQAAARQAVAASARSHAPGFLQACTHPAGSSGAAGRSGRWIRQGDKIVLLGA
jgi:hypothetical protein